MLQVPPANIVQNLVDTKQNHQPNKGSFTSVQMVHTHTNTPWGTIVNQDSLVFADQVAPKTRVSKDPTNITAVAG